MKRSDGGKLEWMAHVETSMDMSYLFADVTVAIAAENATADIHRSRSRCRLRDIGQYYDWYDEKHRYRHEITPVVATASRLERKRMT